MRYREPRLPCDTPVTVLAGGVARRGEVANLSATGARLKGLGDLGRGASVQVRFLDLRVEARVMWSRGAEAGLRFPTPLTPWQVSALRREIGRAPGGPAGARGFREM